MHSFGKSFICIILATGCYFAINHFPNTGTQPSLEKPLVLPTSPVLIEDKGHWVERINTIGGPAAYEELVIAAQGSDPSDQHFAAHAFGGALYTALGLSGISVCDARLSSGCFHEFVGRAIQDQGLASASVLDDKCFVSPTMSSCQHGIGHGVLSHLGYNEASLKKSIDLCKSLRKVETLSGCAAGVFMEYNLRTMIDKSSPRPATDTSGHTDWLAPCDSLGKEYKSCALLLPQWWWVTAIFNKPIPQENQYTHYKDLFIDMGKRCEEFGSNTDLIKACFEGIGQVAPLAAAYDAHTSALLCDAASMISTRRMPCRAFVAILFHNTIGAEKALGACSDLSGAEKDYCTEYAYGTADSSEGAIPFPETR